MLGLSFISLMKNKLPDMNNNAKDLDKLKENYSEELINFIQKLINPLNKIPSTKSVFSEAISSFSYKYLKITSIFSTLQCLMSIPSFVSFFENDKVDKYIKSDENKVIKKFIITQFLKEYLTKNKIIFNYEYAKNECLKLRMNYINNEIDSEINLDTFIKDLLMNLHNELNSRGYTQKVGFNNINSEEEKNNKINKYDIKNIDSSNVEEVISNAIKKYIKNYNSKIDELFFI